MNQTTPTSPEHTAQATGTPATIDTEDCTSCGECINRNGSIFAYNDKGLAFVKDNNAGPYSDIVQAAECCPVMIIHPGDPQNPNEADLDKWKKRADPFQK
jgi:pyruvate-ferredoxin/flavodoxin oxidoreductase